MAPPRRRCIDCRTITTGTRCPACTTKRNAKRWQRKASMYDASHRRDRAEAIKNTDPLTPCPLCGRPLGERVGAGGWDYHHTTTDPHGPRVLTHAACNRSAGRPVF